MHFVSFYKFFFWRLARKLSFSKFLSSVPKSVVFVVWFQMRQSFVIPTIRQTWSLCQFSFLMENSVTSLFFKVFLWILVALRFFCDVIFFHLFPTVHMHILNQLWNWKIVFLRIVRFLFIFASIDLPCSVFVVLMWYNCHFNIVGPCNIYSFVHSKVIASGDINEFSGMFFLLCPWLLSFVSFFKYTASCSYASNGLSFLIFPC